MQQPIFIIGTQRSGTTLLTRMLSAHPGLFIQNEMGTYGVFDKPYTTEALHGRITGRLRDRYSIDVNSLESEGVLWGWKDPMLTPHLDELAEHYPGSKFIVIIRDPRAVVASYIDNAWGLGTTPYTGALRWHDEVTTQLDFCRTLNVILQLFSKNSVLIKSSAFGSPRWTYNLPGKEGCAAARSDEC